MEIMTKVISKEIIKPSSPTPKSLQKHQLSFLDQIMPPFYIPFVYFYASNPQIPNPKKSIQLKKSLSEILSTFYPLAGRYVDNHYVDCNDGGAPFFEAEADCGLSQAFPQTNTDILNKFLPFKMEELQDFCMAVQATYFRCGGIAVAILISHKIADAASYFSFVNAWSAVARNGGGGVPPPKFDAAAYFPPLEDTSALDPTAAITKEEVTTRIFRFPAAAISHLREMYSGGGGGRPSRVEALSAFIWTRYVAATRSGSDPNKISTIYHTVSLRNRVDSPLSDRHFGNLLNVSAAAAAAGDGGGEVVRKIREAVDWARRNNNATEMVDLFGFSSLCRFPLYEADFGWGRPIWVGKVQFPVKNAVFLFETKGGDGIEAYIQLTKQDMDLFEPYFKLQMLIKSNL